MTPDEAKEFARAVSDALARSTAPDPVRELAQTFCVSLPTVRRWAAGTTRPADGIAKYILRTLGEPRA